MTLASIDINDVGLLAAGRHGLFSEGQLQGSPGYALIRNRQLELGRHAWSLARVYPRHIYTRFWDRLDKAPVPIEESTPLSHADLVYHHLAEIWDQLAVRDVTEVIVVVPGHHSHEQLNLLLGICHALSIPVRAMVSAGVVGVPDTDDHNAIYLDICLHRTVMTTLQGGKLLAQSAVVDFDEMGMEQLFEDWSSAIAKAWVDRTRFDPHHKASGEQRVFEQLPALLQHLHSSGKGTVRMEVGSQLEQQEFDETVLQRATEPRYRRLFEAITNALSRQEMALGESRIYLSPRISPLPGFARTFKQILRPAAMEECSSGPVIGAVRYWPQLSEQITEGTIPMLTERARVTTGSQPTATGMADPTHPTHLVHDNRAYGIDHEPLIVAQSADGHLLIGRDQDMSHALFSVQQSSDGPRVQMADGTTALELDGESVSTTTTIAIAVGARLRLVEKDAEFQFIAVDDSSAKKEN